MRRAGASFQQGQGESPFKQVIFDCDGVLVDSETISIRVDQRVLADLGWDLELDEIVRRFVGKSEADFVAQIEEHLEIILPAGWDDGYQDWYRRAFDLHLRAVDGIEEALDCLGLPHCVASSGPTAKYGGLWERQGCCPDSKGGFSAPRTFGRASRHLIFFSMRQILWVSGSKSVRLWKTASMALRPRGLLACMPLPSPGE